MAVEVKRNCGGKGEEGAEDEASRGNQPHAKKNIILPHIPSKILSKYDDVTLPRNVPLDYSSTSCLGVAASSIVID